MKKSIFFHRGLLESISLSKKNRSRWGPAAPGGRQNTPKIFFGRARLSGPSQIVGTRQKTPSNFFRARAAVGPLPNRLHKATKTPSIFFRARTAVGPLPNRLQHKPKNTPNIFSGARGCQAPPKSLCSAKLEKNCPNDEKNGFFFIRRET